jgi:voltage-gated potassium channel
LGVPDPRLTETGAFVPAGPARAVTVRRRLDRFIHDPRVELGIVGLILVSVVLLLLEQGLPAGSAGRLKLRIAGDAVTAVFVFELAIRFYVATKKRRFFARYWPDILAVLPLLRPLRVLRVLLLLRIFRAGALFNRRMSIFRGAFRASVQEVILLLTASLAMILAGSVVLWMAEQGNELAGFESLSEAVWYSAYMHIAGEPIGAQPTTAAGRAATLALMLGGMTIFGVFIGTVSATMTNRLGSLESKPMDLDELSGHTIIFGWNRAGPTVLLELFAGGREDAVVLVTERGPLPEDVPRQGVREELLYHVAGDYTRVEVLDRVGVREAAAAILLADDQTPRSDQDRDARTVLAALTIEKIHPQIFTVAELTNRQNEELLRMANVEEIVVADEYGAVIMGGASRNRGLVSIVDEILSSRYGNSFRKLSVPHKLDGETVGTLFGRLKHEHDAVLIALVRCTGGIETDVLVNPDVAEVVRKGDRLVVLGERELRL